MYILLMSSTVFPLTYFVLILIYIHVVTGICSQNGFLYRNHDVFFYLIRSIIIFVYFMGLSKFLALKYLICSFS